MKKNVGNDEIRAPNVNLIASANEQQSFELDGFFEY
jgi:hypothetical protein